MMKNAVVPPADVLRALYRTPNRHERRAGEAKARRNRKLFARYKAHMAQHGYDATFDDFIKSMP